MQTKEFNKKLIYKFLELRFPNIREITFNTLASKGGDDFFYL